MGSDDDQVDCVIVDEREDLLCRAASQEDAASARNGRLYPLDDGKKPLLSRRRDVLRVGRQRKGERRDEDLHDVDNDEIGGVSLRKMAATALHFSPRRLSPTRVAPRASCSRLLWSEAPTEPPPGQPNARAVRTTRRTDCAMTNELRFRRRGGPDAIRDGSAQWRETLSRPLRDS